MRKLRLGLGIFSPLDSLSGSGRGRGSFTVILSDRLIRRSLLGRFGCWESARRSAWNTAGNIVVLNDELRGIGSFSRWKPVCTFSGFSRSCSLIGGRSCPAIWPSGIGRWASRRRTLAILSLSCLLFRYLGIEERIKIEVLQALASSQQVIARQLEDTAR